jgi:chromosome segregation ATPase
MAAKKSKAAAKKSTWPAAKPVKKSSKKPAARKAKASAKTKASTAKTPAVKKTRSRAKASKAPKSVDSVLKGFDRERVTQQTQLTSVQKQIKEVTAKIKSFESQLVKLQKTQTKTQAAIATLDTRRDHEIGKLLSSLGVNIDNVAIAAESVSKKKIDKPTPLFDATLKKTSSDKAKPKAPAEEKQETKEPAS